MKVIIRATQDSGALLQGIDWLCINQLQIEFFSYSTAVEYLHSCNYLR